MLTTTRPAPDLPPLVHGVLWSLALNVIATDPAASTSAGGAWWEVAIPEVSSRAEIAAARAAYDAARHRQRFIG